MKQSLGTGVSSPGENELGYRAFAVAMILNEVDGLFPSNSIMIFCRAFKVYLNSEGQLRFREYTTASNIAIAKGTLPNWSSTSTPSRMIPTFSGSSAGSPPSFRMTKIPKIVLPWLLSCFQHQYPVTKQITWAMMCSTSHFYSTSFLFLQKYCKTITTGTPT